MYRILPYTLAPIYVAAAFSFHFAGMRQGYDPFSVLLGGAVFAGLLSLLFEWAFPHEVSWFRRDRQLRDDLLHTLFSAAAGIQAGRLLAQVLLAGAAVALTDLLGARPWPSELAFPLQVGLAVIIREFGQYWAHRAMHRVPYLWRYHALHHSANKVTFLNSGRAHPGNQFLQEFLGTSLLVLVAPAEVIIWTLIVANSVTFLSHLNVEMKVGPLNWVLMSPELHRWHHSVDLRESDSNYGIELCIWDVLFGTWYLPRDRRHPEHVGTETLQPDGYFAQLATPFLWRRFTGPAAGGAVPAQESRTD